VGIQPLIERTCVFWRTHLKDLRVQAEKTSVKGNENARSRRIVMMAILVVDDDRALLDGLISLFELRLPGSRIETCESAEAAFERLENSHYDVLISDVKLPGGGLNVLTAAKRVSPWMPVLMISGSGTPDLKQSVRQMGALDLIEKPFDRDRLMRAVVSAVGIYQYAKH
jgi:DNA-binding NtrC family response regulator